MIWQTYDRSGRIQPIHIFLEPLNFCLPSEFFHIPHNEVSLLSDSAQEPVCRLSQIPVRQVSDKSQGPMCHLFFRHTRCKIEKMCRFLTDCYHLAAAVICFIYFSCCRPERFSVFNKPSCFIQSPLRITAICFKGFSSPSSKPVYIHLYSYLFSSVFIFRDSNSQSSL